MCLITNKMIGFVVACFIVMSIIYAIDMIRLIIRRKCLLREIELIKELRYKFDLSQWEPFQERILYKQSEIEYIEKVLKI